MQRALLRTVHRVALLITLAVPGPTQGQGLTTERIYQLCYDRTSSEWQQGKLVCPAFIRGIIDGARLQGLRDAGGSISDHTRLLKICDPPTATGDEALNIVMRFVEARPESRPLPAAVTVYEASGVAWRCDR